MIRATGGAGLIVLMAFAAFGQSAAPRVLEVASIRPHDGPLHTIFGFSSSGTRVTLEGYLPIHLIMEAYKLRTYQIAYAPLTPQPEYIYYDIVAKAEGDGAPTRDEFRPMLQTLLAERFKLKFHREMREMPVYALVVGKNGPKFKESAPDADPIARHGVNGRNQNVTAAKATMEFLANDISNSVFSVDRPAVDKTGLTGTYDIKLEATPDFRLHDGTDDPSDITIFSAVQDQLGLKLDPQKAMVEILVVDHIEKPSGN